MAIGTVHSICQSLINNKRFSGNQVLAFHYVSWALAIPEQIHNLGIDYNKEFEIAKKII